MTSQFGTEGVIIRILINYVSLLDISGANYVSRQMQNKKKMYQELIKYPYKEKNLSLLDVLCISTDLKSKKKISGANYVSLQRKAYIFIGCIMYLDKFTIEKNVSGANYVSL